MSTSRVAHKTEQPTIVLVSANGSSDIVQRHNGVTHFANYHLANVFLSTLIHLSNKLLHRVNYTNYCYEIPLETSVSLILLELCSPGNLIIKLFRRNRSSAFLVHTCSTQNAMGVTSTQHREKKSAAFFP